MRKLITGGLCALAGMIAGCSQQGERPVETNVRHPIAASIAYESFEREWGRYRPGFKLKKKLNDGTELNLKFKAEARVEVEMKAPGKDNLLLMDYEIRWRAGIDEIKNSTIHEQCHNFMVPYCDKGTLKTGNKLFRKALNDLRFEEHLKHYKAQPQKMPNILDGWEDPTESLPEKN